METRKKDSAKITQIAFDKAAKDYSQNLKALTELEKQKSIEIALINKKYESQIENLVSVQDAQFEILKNFVISNKLTLFPTKKKSFTCESLTLGLRKDTPSLVLKEGKVLEDVIKILKEKKPELIRTIDEINKSKIIEERETLESELGNFGLEIKQGEKFFITPQKEKQTP